MMEAYERFELLMNQQIVRTPIALASMAGIVDAAYALERGGHIGAAFLGGFSIDDETVLASHDLAEAGRREFFFPDPIEGIRSEIKKLEGSDIVPGMNLRGSSPASFEHLADEIGDIAIYEIDAHCRQMPMIKAGAGEHLLTHHHDLCDTIRALKKYDTCVSVKIRTGITDERTLSRALWKAGADIIHVDLMDNGYQKIRQIRNACPLQIIANNSMHSYDRVMEQFSHGADLVSVARKADLHTLKGLDAAIRRYADEIGWYNAPKQLCRGGDLRALAFCCMPVKECPLLPALKGIQMDRTAYVDLKRRSVAGTPLQDGAHTCFGSLAWCCKSSTPCMFRDMTLKNLNLSKPEYMKNKRRLSEKIMEEIFREVPADIPC
ncbi:methanogenesis marker 9 domain-containing protein [Methanocalculus taiwanensis]|uniref:Methanogenesis marker 9 domain-containing protein n=1 Tax=Methanocalculus taiwanensis TaxID=106207 RepID=A0ABD4TL90_9EURY|nr:methanogenesis marker 9 domain-containing protein [Methanocalculus taiwanensis]MCQ1538959.1 methanogenesis marker 9 domain-containing protein [Methanocalculus taiwanensis]